jgi:hypothetical protein
MDFCAEFESLAQSLYREGFRRVYGPHGLLLWSLMFAFRIDLFRAEADRCSVFRGGGARGETLVSIRTLEVVDIALQA